MKLFKAAIYECENDTCIFHCELISSPVLRVPQDGVSSKTTKGSDGHTVKGFMWHACMSQGLCQ